MTLPPDSSDTSTIRHRRPREGERTRGAADALQTKIAVAAQSLDAGSHKEQLSTIMAELSCSQTISSGTFFFWATLTQPFQAEA